MVRWALTVPKAQKGRDQAPNQVQVQVPSPSPPFTLKSFRQALQKILNLTLLKVLHYQYTKSPLPPKTPPSGIFGHPVWHLIFPL